MHLLVNVQIQINNALISQIPYLLTKYLLGWLIHCESKVRMSGKKWKNLIVNKTQLIIVNMT